MWKTYGNPDYDIAKISMRKNEIGIKMLARVAFYDIHIRTHTLKSF